ncbi:VRR-NUC domain-containing protein [Granulicoccus phenolivorans]|uniref:VRR-NUC domain-containing protein n=1 Tax=Granulicoccus phenolivorans TaxID=266854 RepID=UPI0004232A2A|nr:VRR-NUC domain-containing protein [Granulicoccus phenolivorans]
MPRLYAPPRENPIETYLLAQCRAHDLLCLKFVSPGRVGVPDRVLVAPGATVFVEVKRPGGAPDPRQTVMHAKLRRSGGTVAVVAGRADVDRLLARLRGRRRPDPDRAPA